MEQRDLLKEQIEQLGRAIGKVITGFLGLKADGNVMKGFEITNQQFKSELGLDIEKILSLNKRDLSDYLLSKNIGETGIIQLAEYVEMIGEHRTDNSDKAGAFNSAINLYEIANAKSDTFDMNRQFKINTLKRKL